jgi:hypothetical protein
MSDYEYQVKNERLQMELDMMKQQMNFMMTMMSGAKGNKTISEEIVFENLNPTETLAEMMNRLGDKLTWSELDTYSDSEEFAFETLVKWLTSKNLNDRPIRYSKKDYWIYENKKNEDGVNERQWIRYPVSEVINKTFERFNRNAWRRVDVLAKNGKSLRVTSFLATNYESDGDNLAGLLRMEILNKILNKDESKLFGVRSSLLKKLNRYLGS